MASACSSLPIRQHSPPRRSARTNSVCASWSIFCCVSPCTLMMPLAPVTSSSPARRISRLTILAARLRSRSSLENEPVDWGNASCCSRMNCSSVLNPDERVVTVPSVRSGVMSEEKVCRRTNRQATGTHLLTAPIRTRIAQTSQKALPNRAPIASLPDS